MPGQYDRNRNDQRGPQDWRERENYGREQEPPRDDRGRFMSEGERGPYYGGTDYDDYGDRHYRERYEGRPGGQEYDREIERDFGAYQSSYGPDQRLGGRDQPRDRDYFRGSQRGYDPQGNRRGSMEWREQDYDDRRGLGQSRGRYADPQDQGHEPRDRWQGSGGSRWDENDRRGREQARDPRGQRHPGGDEHRGWFGDARGHAEAARRGWRHRGH